MRSQFIRNFPRTLLRALLCMHSGMLVPVTVYHLVPLCVRQDKKRKPRTPEEIAERKVFQRFPPQAPQALNPHGLFWHEMGMMGGQARSRRKSSNHAEDPA